MRDPQRSPLAPLVAMVVTGIGVALSAGCSSTPEVDGATAQRTYSPILQEIADATATAAKVSWTRSTPSSIGATTDGCTWFSGTLESKTDLRRTPGWDKVSASIEGILNKHGFDALTPSELKGGYTGLESRDAKGGHLMISSKGPTDLRIAVPVTDPC